MADSRGQGKPFTPFPFHGLNGFSSCDRSARAPTLSQLASSFLHIPSCPAPWAHQRKNAQGRFPSCSVAGYSGRMRAGGIPIDDNAVRVAQELLQSKQRKRVGYTSDDQAGFPGRIVPDRSWRAIPDRQLFARCSNDRPLHHPAGIEPVYAGGRHPGNPTGRSHQHPCDREDRPTAAGGGGRPPPRIPFCKDPSQELPQAGGSCQGAGVSPGGAAAAAAPHAVLRMSLCPVHRSTPWNSSCWVWTPRWWRVSQRICGFRSRRGRGCWPRPTRSQSRRGPLGSRPPARPGPRCAALP